MVLKVLGCQTLPIGIFCLDELYKCFPLILDVVCLLLFFMPFRINMNRDIFKWHFITDIFAIVTMV